MASLVDMITGLKFKNKKAAAFGCYGWSGESVKILSERLTKAGFELISNDGLRTMWEPGDDELAQAFEYGKEIAEKT
jgi:flavorubredoxin